MKECIDLKASCRYRLANKYCMCDYEVYINKDKYKCEFAIPYKKKRKINVKVK